MPDARDLPWVQLPPFLDEDQAVELRTAFDSLGIAHDAEALQVESGPGGGRRGYVLRVRRDHAQAAAKVFAALWDVQDPAAAAPFTGECGACGAHVEAALTCPDCGLNFGAGYEEGHPFVVWVRELGGFVGEEEVESSEPPRDR